MISKTKLQRRWATLMVFSVVCFFQISCGGDLGDEESLGSVEQAAHWTTLNERTFTKLCPKHIGGDKEYNGHGPEIEAQVELFTKNNGHELWVRIYMHQKETMHNWTEALYDDSHRLYRASGDKKITKLYYNGITYNFNNISEEGPVVDVPKYTDKNHSTDTHGPNQFVKRIIINGDTDGNDVGNCTWDDAYITVTLFSIRVWEEDLIPIPDNSCEERCGQKAPAGCWCDNACLKYNDCCPDKPKHCG